MKKTLSALLLSTVLMTPMVVWAADDHDRDDRARNRYYDPDYRDYHEWNEHEERAYREYLKERRHEYREWSKADRKEQKEYWMWRHKHPDAELFRDEH
jgi:Ni/Co efflux regulator RcnB